jgi:methionyl-tRNA synthetase
MLNLPQLKWKDAQDGSWLEPGHNLGKVELLFDKIEDHQIDAQIRKLMDTKKSNETTHSLLKPAKSGIEYDDFGKMDIRAGTILEAEKVAKTKKLLKLKIDTGIDVRTVVSGIAEDFEPAEIIGKRVCILINLETKNLKGIESKGMILMGENPDGKLFFVTPDEGTLNGSVIK